MNVAFFATWLVVLTAPALAGSSVLELGAPVARTPYQVAAKPSASERDAWVDRIVAARRQVEKARLEVSQSRATYGRMRSKNRLRGEARNKVRQAREDAQVALENAEKNLATLLELARRKGVPPGWIREAMEGFEESPPASSR